MPDQQLSQLELAFLTGFAASREGFNGECEYGYLAPTWDEFTLRLSAAKAGCDIHTSELLNLMHRFVDFITGDRSV